MHGRCKFLRMQITGSYANARNMCSSSNPSSALPSWNPHLSTLRPFEDDRNAPSLHILDISSHCIEAIVPWVLASGWDDNPSDRGCKPLIRISFESKDGLTDSFECSQDTTRVVLTNHLSISFSEVNTLSLFPIIPFLFSWTTTWKTKRSLMCQPNFSFWAKVKIFYFSFKRHG